MTTKELMEDIGKDGVIGLGGLEIKVEIKDVKMSYGRQRWLVAPKAGAGEIWVESIAI